MHESMRVFSDPKPRNSVLVALLLAGILLSAVLLTHLDLSNPSSAGFIAMALLGPTMAAVDIREYRLPDLLTLATGSAAVIGSITVCAFEGEWSKLAFSTLYAIAAAGVFYVLALLTSGGIGLGDIKLLAVIGFTVGLNGWQTLVYCIAVAFIIGAVVAIIARLKQTEVRELPFGPFLIVATLITGLFVPTAA